MAKILRYGQFVKINENNQTDYRSSVSNQLGSIKLKEPRKLNEQKGLYYDYVKDYSNGKVTDILVTLRVDNLYEILNSIKQIFNNLSEPVYSGGMMRYKLTSANYNNDDNLLYLRFNVTYSEEYYDLSSVTSSKEVNNVINNILHFKERKISYKIIHKTNMPQNPLNIKVNNLFLNENNQTDYRGSVSNQLGIDKSEFEDSLDLGDMADELEIQNRLYKNMKKDMEYEIEYLMKDFIENNDVSMYFTKTLSNDFDYDKELNLYNRVLRYYENTYREESGTIENDYKPLFNDVLRGAVKSFLTKRVVESKEVSTSHYLISKEKINASINNNSEELDKKKYALYVDEEDLSMMKIREKVKEKGFLSAIQISKDSYNKYKKYLKTVKVSK